MSDHWFYASLFFTILLLTYSNMISFLIGFGVGRYSSYDLANKIREALK